VTLPKAWMSWSTGKDSAWALHTIRKRQEIEVVALLTTVNAPAARVAMHAVRTLACSRSSYMNSRGSRGPYQSREAAELADRSHDPWLKAKLSPRYSPGKSLPL
jgi:diphthamide synthase (EF-2-diphthine--ammonia ligase)